MQHRVTHWALVVSIVLAVGAPVCRSLCTTAGAVLAGSVDAAPDRVAEPASTKSAAMPCHGAAPVPAETPTPVSDGEESPAGACGGAGGTCLAARALSPEPPPAATPAAETRIALAAVAPPRWLAAHTLAPRDHAIPPPYSPDILLLDSILLL